MRQALRLELRMALRFALAVLCTLWIAAAAPPANADVPQLVHFRGGLTDALGEAIHCPSVADCPSGAVSVTFRLYGQPLGGAPAWEETHSSVAVAQGAFDVILGIQTPLDAEVLDLATAYLGMEVNETGELSPRQVLVGSPYAVWAQRSVESSAADDAAHLGGVEAGQYVTLDAVGGLCVTDDELDAVLVEAAFLTDADLTSWLADNGYEPGSTGVSAEDVEPIVQALLDAQGYQAGAHFSGAWDDVTDKPAFAALATSGAWEDVAGKPEWAAVALSGSFNDLLEVPSWHAVAFSGSYDDLSDTPSLAAIATSGSWDDLGEVPDDLADGDDDTQLTEAEVDDMVANNGYLAPGDPLDQSNMPANGLNEVSNGLISNQFIDSVASIAQPVPIPDNNPGGVVVFLNFPDIGVAEKLDVTVDLDNSDPTNLAVWLTDPDGVNYALYCGEAYPSGADPELAGATCDGTATAGVTGSWPDPAPSLTGDLTSWVGRNPTGQWTLSVKDSGFLNNADDGAVLAFTIDIRTLSSKKVVVDGDLIVTGTVSGSGGLTVDGDLDLSGNELTNARLQVANAPPSACGPANVGAIYFDIDELVIKVCDGTDWLGVAAGICGDGKVQGAENCDDNNVENGDGCNTACQPETGFICSGFPSQCIAICGDGLIAGSEACDDGDGSDGDGCDSACELESGWSCGGEPSACTAVCGDGARLGDEECDDGDLATGDGCSGLCVVESGWDCDAPLGATSTCDEICGDGLQVGSEQCDDNNTIECDGCSSTCVPGPQGTAYQGVCLVAKLLTSEADTVPAGCSAYTPGKLWGQADWEWICNTFSGPLGYPETACGSIDTDPDGGRCNNYAALTSWEPNTGPDVWVHSGAFTWDPNNGSGASCQILSANPSIVVYACQ